MSLTYWLVQLNPRKAGRSAGGTEEVSPAARAAPGRLHGRGWLRCEPRSAPLRGIPGTCRALCKTGPLWARDSVQLQGLTRRAQAPVSNRL